REQDPPAIRRERGARRALCSGDTLWRNLIERPHEDRIRRPTDIRENGAVARERDVAARRGTVWQRERECGKLDARFRARPRYDGSPDRASHDSEQRREPNGLAARRAA